MAVQTLLYKSSLKNFSIHSCFSFKQGHHQTWVMPCLDWLPSPAFLPILLPPSAHSSGSDGWDSWKALADLVHKDPSESLSMCTTHTHTHKHSNEGIHEEICTRGMLLEGLLNELPALCQFYLLALKFTFSLCTPCLSWGSAHLSLSPRASVVVSSPPFQHHVHLHTVTRRGL